MLKQLFVSTLAIVSLNCTADKLSKSTHLTKPFQEKTMKSITTSSVQLNTTVGPLAANLYLPEGVEKPPVVVVTGAWTTVKEQMPAVYAQALAKQGYAAVTFDFRGWGQSQGQEKYLESPALKTQDIKAVFDALSGIEQIDATRMAGLGICASSGYMLDATFANDNVKSVALVAPWLHDKPMATAIYGGEESVKNLIKTAQAAELSVSPQYIEAASTTNEQSLMFQVPYYTETDRGLIAEYDNQFNLASWDDWLNYDAQQTAKAYDKPMLMVASEVMALPAGAHQYLDNAGNNVSAVWLDGVSQFDFYDQEQAVSAAVDAVVNHFNNSL